MDREHDETGDYITIGAITKPHGVRGEMRVHPFNPESSLWKKLKEVRLVFDDGRTEMRALRRTKKAAKYVILSLEGVDSVEAVDALRRVEVQVPRERLPATPDDEFYYVDLPGMAIHDEMGEVLGEAVRVLEYPAVDCLEVRETAGGIRELPLTRPWLRDVDENRRVIVVRDWLDLPQRSS